MKKIIILLIAFKVVVYAFDSTGDSYVNLFGFQVNKTTLSEVQKKIGGASVITDGDAGNSSKRINYFIKKSNCYITFDVSEMGGDETITAFILSSQKPNESFTEIKTLDLSPCDIGGLHLGMDFDDLKRIFGKDLKSYNNQPYIHFEKQIPLTEKEIVNLTKHGVDVPKGACAIESTSIMISLQKNKAFKIVVMRNKSY
jgi:hypothetical protein